MKIIRDSDSVERIDASGDKLVLLESPRQRDVLKCADIASSEAIAALDKLKASGVDISEIMADASKDPEAMKAAQKEAEASPDAPAVRRFKLQAVALWLVVDGEKLGGDAILEAYSNMNSESADWVDQQVAGVWASATPTEADTRGEDADAQSAVGVGVKPSE